MNNVYILDFLLGNFLILLLNTYVVEKIPNDLKKQKIFFFADKLSLHNITAFSGLKIFW